MVVLSTILIFVSANDACVVEGIGLVKGMHGCP